MTKKILWLVVNCLMVLSMVLAGCTPAATPTTPATQTTATTPTTPITTTTPPTPTQVQTQQGAVAPTGEAPRYGGMINVAGTDVTVWDPYSSAIFFQGLPTAITNQTLWMGDWTKGPAGGYGSNVTAWVYNGTDVWDNYTGAVAESWKWSLDPSGTTGTLIYQIRSGMHYALNPNSEASRLVN